MPRYLTVLFILLGLASTSQAQQSCPCGGGSRMTDTQISNLLGSNTVCAIVGNERWQEWHNGNAIYELGNNANGENVGTWSVIGTGDTALVNYNYGTGGAYSYVVCDQNPLYHFCGAKNVTNALVKSGKGGC